MKKRCQLKDVEGRKTPLSKIIFRLIRRDTAQIIKLKKKNVKENVMDNIIQTFERTA